MISRVFLPFSFPFLSTLPGKRKFGGSYSSAGFIFNTRHDSLITLTSKPAVHVDELHFVINNIFLNKIPIKDSLFSAPLLIAFQKHQFQIFRQSGLTKITTIPLDPVLRRPMSIIASNFIPNRKLNRSSYIPWEGSIELPARKKSPTIIKFKYILTVKPL